MLFVIATNQIQLNDEGSLYHLIYKFIKSKLLYNTAVKTRYLSKDLLMYTTLKFKSPFNPGCKKSDLSTTRCRF